MRPGARTPEELETLFEDACLVGDRTALAGLFEDGAVLAVRGATSAACGPDGLASVADRLLAADLGYIAGDAQVIVARDTGLVAGRHGIHVVRRDASGAWRYVIALLAAALPPPPNGGPMTNETTPALRPHAIAAQEGEARWWFDALAVIRATGADTGGQMTIVEMTEPAGAQAPLHVHHREDEAFWILEGSVIIEVGDTTVACGPGDYAFGPRDIPHRYSVGPDGCRMLFICTPAGFEGLVRDMSRPAQSRTLPPPSEPDFAMVARVAQDYGCELLG